MGGNKKKQRAAKKAAKAAKAAASSSAGANTEAATAAAAAAPAASAAAPAPAPAAAAAAGADAAGTSAAAAAAAAGAGGGAGGAPTKEQIAEAMFGFGRRTHKVGGAESKDHKFWKTQPVIGAEKAAAGASGAGGGAGATTAAAAGGAASATSDGSSKDGVENGPVEVKTVDEVRQEPLNLLAPFEWSTIDLDDDEQIAEVYKLLTENYVTDDDGMFRFDYSPAFLRWAMSPPGYYKDWMVGVRQKSNGRLRGFISGIPVECTVYGKTMKMCEINFLCVHRKLRDKRLAPTLIKEVTRRVNLQNIWQAVYTAGVKLPGQVSVAHYYHRPLNVPKLLDIGFLHKHPRMSKNGIIRLHRVKDSPQTPGLREMEKRDIPAVTKLFVEYQSKFDLWCKWDEEEAAHWLLPRKDVVSSYVVEDPETGAITDFCSYYHLPQSILQHERHKRMGAGYSFYNVSTKTPLKQLMNDLLVLAHKAGCDVFNALDLMENLPMFKELKFGPGDGNLQYYLYNWKCSTMKHDRLGLVLL